MFQLLLSIQWKSFSDDGIFQYIITIHFSSALGLNCTKLHPLTNEKTNIKTKSLMTLGYLEDSMAILFG